MNKCPKCQSREIHRSRTHNRWEIWRKAIMGKRPFRCRACGWRGWGVDDRNDFTEEEIGRAAQVVAADAALARGEDSRGEFSLDVLDSREVHDPSGRKDRG